MNNIILDHAIDDLKNKIARLPTYPPGGQVTILLMIHDPNNGNQETAMRRIGQEVDDLLSHDGRAFYNHLQLPEG